jgi:hypothetical protein
VCWRGRMQPFPVVRARAPAEISKQLQGEIKTAAATATRGEAVSRMGDGGMGVANSPPPPPRPTPHAPGCAGKALLDKLKAEGEALHRTNPKSERLQPYRQQYMVRAEGGGGGGGEGGGWWSAVGLALRRIGLSWRVACHLSPRASHRVSPLLSCGASHLSLRASHRLCSLRVSRRICPPRAAHAICPLMRRIASVPLVRRIPSAPSCAAYHLSLWGPRRICPCVCRVASHPCSRVSRCICPLVRHISSHLSPPPPTRVSRRVPRQVLCKSYVDVMKVHQQVKERMR